MSENFDIKAIRLFLGMIKNQTTISACKALATDALESLENLAASQASPAPLPDEQAGELATEIKRLAGVHAAEFLIRNTHAEWTAMCAAIDRLASLASQSEEQGKDAGRLDFIEKNARCDPKMCGNHVWWPTTFRNALKGPTLREAIDAAMATPKESA